MLLRSNKDVFLILWFLTRSMLHYIINALWIIKYRRRKRRTFNSFLLPRAGKKNSTNNPKLSSLSFASQNSLLRRVRHAADPLLGSFPRKLWRNLHHQRQHNLTCVLHINVRDINICTHITHYYSLLKFPIISTSNQRQDSICVTHCQPCCAWQELFHRTSKRGNFDNSWKLRTIPSSWYMSQ